MEDRSETEKRRINDGIKTKIPITKKKIAGTFFLKKSKKFPKQSNILIFKLYIKVFVAVNQIKINLVI
jgi:hypothetical protein